jgi:hypothetical protein
MKRVLYASVIALGCTIAVAAHGGMAAGQSKEKEKEKPMAKEAAKTVAVTGCVAESGGHYMLNNATTADAAGAPMSYALSGGTLKPHVGHKVEITGTVKPAASGKDSMSKDSMKKDTMSKDKPMAKEDAATGGTLAVKSLKMVAPSCS